MKTHQTLFSASIPGLDQFRMQETRSSQTQSTMVRCLLLHRLWACWSGLFPVWGIFIFRGTTSYHWHFVKWRHTRAMSDFSRQVGLSLGLIQAMELGVFANDTNWQILLVELCLIGQRAGKRFDAVRNELAEIAVLEWVQVLLQVCTSRLRSCTDGHCLAVIVVGAWACLIEFRSRVVVAGDEKSNTVWSSIVALRAHLKLQAKQVNESTDWIVAIVRVLMIDALLTHVAAQDASVGGDASHWDADMIVYLQDLLLMRWQLRCCTFECDQHSIVGRLESNSCWAELDSLHGVLDLMDASLRTPDGHIAIVLIAKLKVKEIKVIIQIRQRWLVDLLFMLLG